jgi:hypothetical protein
MAMERDRTSFLQHAQDIRGADPFSHSLGVVSAVARCSETHRNAGAHHACHNSEIRNTALHTANVSLVPHVPYAPQRTVDIISSSGEFTSP